MCWCVRRNTFHEVLLISQEGVSKQLGPLPHGAICLPIVPFNLRSAVSRVSGSCWRPGPSPIEATDLQTPFCSLSALGGFSGTYFHVFSYFLRTSVRSEGPPRLWCFLRMPLQQCRPRLRHQHRAGWLCLGTWRLRLCGASVGNAARFAGFTGGWFAHVSSRPLTNCVAHTHSSRAAPQAERPPDELLQAV